MNRVDPMSPVHYTREDLSVSGGVLKKVVLDQANLVGQCAATVNYHGGECQQAQHGKCNCVQHHGGGEGMERVLDGR